MKKLVFAAVAALLMTTFITSCKKEDSSCYKVSYTIPKQEAQYDADGNVTRKERKAYDQTCYKWMTSSDQSAYKDALTSLGYTNIVIEAVADYKTKDACLYNGNPGIKEE